MIVYFKYFVHHSLTHHQPSKSIELYWKFVVTYKLYRADYLFSFTNTFSSAWY
jgi:hypothetical protein